METTTTSGSGAACPRGGIFPTTKRRLSFLLTLLVVWVSIGPAVAQERALLYHAGLNGKLSDIAQILRQPVYPRVAEERLTWTTDYFVRIAPRQAILTEANQVSDTAFLGTRAWVFVTTPESLTGRSLLDIYLDIGYEAEDIVGRQRNQEMVAIVFRYPPPVVVSAVRDGRLPPNWDTQVYIPTWENMFALFARLAVSATVATGQPGERAPDRLVFRSPAEKAFALSFPEEGKARITRVSYAELKAVGGADWVYRQLLESHLSVFEHFRGNGRTHNEVRYPKVPPPEAGLVEMVGPNWKVAELPEVAILHLGQLTIEDTYSTGQPLSRREQ
jgi:hypothetical protein